MVENFRPLRQLPGSNSCLPTAIRAVLLWYEVEASQEEVSEWCREDPYGCVLELALYGLREADFDIEELNALTQTEARDLVRSIVADPEDAQPVIVTLQNLRLSTTQDHAVVVLDVRHEQRAEGEREVVEYMDPLTGEIEQDATGSFWQYWSFAQMRAFIIRP